MKLVKNSLFFLIILLFATNSSAAHEYDESQRNDFPNNRVYKCHEDGSTSTRPMCKG